MGTDAHLMVEVKNARDGNDWHPMAGDTEVRQLPRMYPLFAALASVCNQSGLWERQWKEPTTAVVDDHEVEVPGWWYDPDDGGFDPINAIALPRGVPDDANAYWMAFALYWKIRTGDEAKTTWVTIEEFMAFDWDQVIYRQGVVPEEEYIEYVETGKAPSHVAGAGGGEGVRVVNEVEYAAGARGENTTLVSMRFRAGTSGILDLVHDPHTLAATWGGMAHPT